MSERCEYDFKNNILYIYRNDRNIARYFPDRDEMELAPSEYSIEVIEEHVEFETFETEASAD